MSRRSTDHRRRLARILVLAAIPILACSPPTDSGPTAEQGSAAETPAAAETTEATGDDVGLAPSADEADVRLESSPRHGEWVDVAAGDGDTVRAWIVYPQRSDAAPVVVVIHEIFGLTDWVRAVADQLAADGFVAIAPDLLSGKGVDGGGSETLDRDAAVRRIRGLDAAEVVRRIEAAARHATADPAATDSHAVIGFCWGGSTTFRYATEAPDLDAAVVFYGTPPGGDALARIEAPVLGLYGGDDARVTSTVEPTREEMARLGKSYETEVYPGAGHGFLRAQGERGGANTEAARQAWPQTIDFLRERLEDR